jgi:hypothetical protein
MVHRVLFGRAATLLAAHGVAVQIIVKRSLGHLRFTRVNSKSPWQKAGLALRHMKIFLEL